MKTLLKSTLAALSVAIFFTFACSSCENQRLTSMGGGWHNMGNGPKERHQMPDANMPVSH
jgi:hypothetical protein